MNKLKQISLSIKSLVQFVEDLLEDGTGRSFSESDDFFLKDQSLLNSPNENFLTETTNDRNRIEKLLRAKELELRRLVRRDITGHNAKDPQQLTAELERAEATIHQLTALRSDLAAGEEALFGILDAQKLAHDAKYGDAPPPTVLPPLPAGTAVLHAAFMMGLKSTGTTPPPSRSRSAPALHPSSSAHRSCHPFGPRAEQLSARPQGRG